MANTIVSAYCVRRRNGKIKIVLKISSHYNCNKCRKKIFKKIACIEGTESLELQGAQKDLMVVVGDKGLDPVRVVVALRKIAYANIVSVGPADFKPWVDRSLNMHPRKDKKQAKKTGLEHWRPQFLLCGLLSPKHIETSPLRRPVIKGSSSSNSAHNQHEDEIVLSTKFTNLKLIEPEMVNNVKVARCSTKDAAQGAIKWSGSLVGYFLNGNNPSQEILNKAVKGLWLMKESCNTFSLGNGYFLFKFSLEEDKYNVIEHEPWFVSKNEILKLTDWTPEMRFAEKMEYKSLPIWVKFPNLPFHLWSEEFLSKVGSLVGKPIYTDRMTANGERLDFAKLRIEVSAEDELPNEVITILDNGREHVQKVAYDWMPSRCSRCLTFGHSTHECRVLHIVEVNK